MPSVLSNAALLLKTSNAPLCRRVMVHRAFLHNHSQYLRTQHAPAARRKSSEVTLLTFYHQPDSPQSKGMLEKLEAAQAGTLPPKLSHSQKNKGLPGKVFAPVDCELTVHERLPTLDELKEISLIMPGGPTEVNSFVKPAHQYANLRATNARTLHELLVKHPDAMRWPVIVDWSKPRVVLGDYKEFQKMLKYLLHEQEGTPVPEEPGPKVKEQVSVIWKDYD